MTGTGTIINALAILVGGIAGLTISRQLSPTTQSRIKIGLAIFTVVAGFKMLWAGINGSLGAVMRQMVIVMLSVMFGNALGRALGLQKSLNRFGRYASEKFSKAQAGKPAAPGDGFITCTLLFCVGPMAILGAIQDGLSGDFKTLAIKSAMDGLSAMVFASTFGWSVLLSIIPVVAYQGTITICAKLLAPHLSSAMLDSINATGGMIVFCIPIIILELRKVELINYLPALVLAPLLTWLWH